MRMKGRILYHTATGKGGIAVFWPWKKPQFNFERFLKKTAKFDPFEIKKYEALFGHLRENAQQVECKKLGLRLLVISDSHGYFAFGENRLPECLDTIGEFDLCVLLGDVHPAEMPRILDCIPREKIIALKGNHDTFSIYSDFGVRDIAGTDFEYKGVRFVGIDGSFRYKTERFPSHTQHGSLQIAHRLPEADVLLTHDIMLSDFGRDPAHAGLIGITYYIYEKKPIYHLHGHIHKSYWKRYENGTNEKSIYLCEYIEI